jgi:xylulose-5-phosphate/fructose-6-phosphate phosphoketolase
MEHPAPTLPLPDHVGGHKVADSQGTLSYNALMQMNAYWRAANYLSVGQIYLYDNPLLHEPLTFAHVKPFVVGHWEQGQGKTSSMSTSIRSSKATILT